MSKRKVKLGERITCESEFLDWLDSRLELERLRLSGRTEAKACGSTLVGHATRSCEGFRSRSTLSMMRYDQEDLPRFASSVTCFRQTSIQSKRTLP